MLLGNCKLKHKLVITKHLFVVVQLISRVRLFETPWTAALQASLSITNSPSLLKLMSYRVGDAIQPSHPVIPFSSCLQPFPASGSFQMSQFFVSGGPKYWSFSISPYKYSGQISFRMDWFDLHAVQGTRKSSPTPQFKSINSSALSFLHSLTLTSIHDHWENHSLD